MKASQLYTQFDITVSSHHTESLNTIERMPQVKSVIVLDSLRYHVTTKIKQRPSLFKRQLPNITMICKYNQVKKKIESVVDLDTEEEDISEDSFDAKHERKLAAYKSVGMSKREMEYKAYRQYINLEKEAEARLRRELEQIETAATIGFSVDTDDEVSQYKPEMRFYPASQELVDKEKSQKRILKEIRAKHGFDSEQELDYWMTI